MSRAASPLAGYLEDAAMDLEHAQTELQDGTLDAETMLEVAKSLVSCAARLKREAAQTPD